MRMYAVPVTILLVLWYSVEFPQRSLLWSQPDSHIAAVAVTDHKEHNPSTRLSSTYPPKR